MIKGIITFLKAIQVRKAHSLGIFLGSLFIFLGGCKEAYTPDLWDQYFQLMQGEWNEKLTEVIIEDIFTPPVASRIYAYSNIAAYEAMQARDSTYISLAGQLNGLEALPQPKHPENTYFPLSGLIAFTTCAQKLVFAADRVQEFEQTYLKQVEAWGIQGNIRQNSVEWGRKVGEAISAWANEDGYHQRQALPAHFYSEDDSAWTPTPPTYMQGIEPHWNTLRTFVLDSAKQFKPLPPTQFNTDPKSRFFLEAQEVYQKVKNAGEEEIEIAKFWDCNPNIAYFKGHVMMFHQKISPGGHWISITDLASKKQQLSIMEEAEAFAVTSIALADAFISCWDEKYRSNLIRPETYIERHIDSTWFPLLETPAFPEYTSGHSVISAAAATTLSHLLGDQVEFVDSTEVKFGLPARSFASFAHAADEAAISRLYGGIHYRPAIENGVAQGKEIGAWVLDNLQTKKEQ
ncbi:MAG: vanadium-dependent haloperoxidase [Bacteroidota bacterium]